MAKEASQKYKGGTIRICNVPEQRELFPCK